MNFSDIKQKAVQAYNKVAESELVESISEKASEVTETVSHKWDSIDMNTPEMDKLRKVIGDAAEKAVEAVGGWEAFKKTSSMFMSNRKRADYEEIKECDCDPDCNCCGRDDKA